MVSAHTLMYLFSYTSKPFSTHPSAITVYFSAAAGPAKFFAFALTVRKATRGPLAVNAATILASCRSKCTHFGRAELFKDCLRKLLQVLVSIFICSV
jgi:hypothetical protein